MVKINRALDENDNLVFISQAESNQKYFCEICHAELIVKASNSALKSKHFAHKPGSDCSDDWSNHNNKGDWHIKWQERFPEEWREVPVGDENEKHRADVSILELIVEFQHSPISYEDFTKRNHFYTKYHNDVVWVFDGDSLINWDWKDYNPRKPWIISNRHKFNRTQNQFKDFDCENGSVKVYFQKGERLYESQQLSPQYVSLTETDITCHSFVERMVEKVQKKLDKILEDIERSEKHKQNQQEMNRPKVIQQRPVFYIRVPNYSPQKPRRRF